MTQPTLFLRLEGPLQAWGRQYAKWVYRDTGSEPAKSGVIGLLCCVFGLRRDDPELRVNPENKRPITMLERLNDLKMGVRVDREGTVITDYQTVGANYGNMSAEGKIKYSHGEIETLETWRQYLCDASFLVALQGNATMLRKVKERLLDPIWVPYLGRKSCPPSRPILEHDAISNGFTESGEKGALQIALEFIPWRPRLSEVDGREPPDAGLRAVVECAPVTPGGSLRYDVLYSLLPPRHGPRYVIETLVHARTGQPSQVSYQPPAHERRDKIPVEIRTQILARDGGLCVFCKQPYDDLHHLTYERMNNELPEDLVSLCTLCHDAITMLEEEHQMLGERVDCREKHWRGPILAKRAAILEQREAVHGSGKGR